MSYHASTPNGRGCRASLLMAVTAAGIAAVLGLGATEAMAQLTMRLTDHSPGTHPNAVAAAEMIKRIEQRTGGQLKIAHFPNSTLGSSPEQADQVRRGVIDFGQISPGVVAAYNKAAGMLNAPYVFDDYEHVWKFFDKYGRDWVTAELEKAGFVFLDSFEWGFRAMTTSSRVINGPDDVKGLRMRTPPELALRAVYEALSATPQAINFQEVYMALASNTVDGQCNPLATIHSAKFYEVQKFIAFTKHQYTASMLVASALSWKKLTPEQQKIVREESRTAALAARKGVVDQDKWYIDEFKRAGATVTLPNVADFRAKMGPAYERIKKDVGEQIFDAVIKVADEARRGS